ncbi:hypothetical protein Celaphus_00009911 [Cervus elaphus hippelaphus]|uniref:Uncharacterized protein n=1 Tax=Cervus elaphus hippelaphus TaxID=46360 RepID=A0A212BZE4_CEREH|nr:hypothetical protein Celaphus_00009911 [Cervus elaphus hippelaphus]
MRHWRPTANCVQWGTKFPNQRSSSSWNQERAHGHWRRKPHITAAQPPKSPRKRGRGCRQKPEVQPANALLRGRALGASILPLEVSGFSPSAIFVSQDGKLLRLQGRFHCRREI